MKVECPRCHTHVEKPLQGDPICPTCGFGAPEGPPGAGTGMAAVAAQPPAGAASPPSPPPAGIQAPSAPAGWEGTGAPAAAAPKQGLAITALVLGIMGCCIFPLFGVGGIVVGAIALKKIKDEPQVYGGHGMALTGLILGIIGTIFGIILIAFYAAIIAAVFDCEENPDSEFCRQLEDESALLDGGAGGASAVATTSMAAPAGPWMPRRRPWHAG